LSYLRIRFYVITAYHSGDGVEPIIGSELQYTSLLKLKRELKTIMRLIDKKEIDQVSGGYGRFSFGSFSVPAGAAIATAIAANGTSDTDTNGNSTATATTTGNGTASGFGFSFSSN